MRLGSLLIWYVPEQIYMWWLVVNNINKIKKLNHMHTLLLKDTWHKIFKSSWEFKSRDDFFFQFNDINVFSIMCICVSIYYYWKGIHIIKFVVIVKVALAPEWLKLFCLFHLAIWCICIYAPWEKLWKQVDMWCKFLCLKTRPKWILGWLV